MKHQPASADFRNVQTELWTYLDDKQKEVVARTFCHLKNHLQIEVAEALIYLMAANIQPDPRDWSCAFADHVYNFIIQRFSTI